MQLTVYGAGYLGTVVSACLADMGTPVTCCDYDSEPIIERAQGRIGFYEKNHPDSILEDELKKWEQGYLLIFCSFVPAHPAQC